MARNHMAHSFKNVFVFLSVFDFHLDSDVTARMSD